MNTGLKGLLTGLAAALLAGIVAPDIPVSAVSGSSQGDGPMVTRPSYAPDGREVAFWTTWRGGHQIWAVSRVDGRLRPIAADAETKIVQLEPAWSPTGSWIALASNRAGNFDIWLVRPDASGLTQLTTDRATDDQPAWSPNGTQIAFVSDRAG